MLEQKGLSKHLFIDETAEVVKETLGLLSINEKISELFDRATDLVFPSSQTEYNSMAPLLLLKRLLD